MAPSNLTFAEAMALDPSDVEVNVGEGWMPLRDADGWPHRVLRSASFRRARHRRSRVQEMGDNSTWKSNDPCWRSADESIRRETIRAVCEYLAQLPPCERTAAKVEREFLEER